MNRMRLVIVPVLVLVSAFTVLAKSKEEKQAEARKKADATLQRLYKARPHKLQSNPRPAMRSLTVAAQRNQVLKDGTDLNQLR